MPNKKIDRQVQRTRELLKNALIQLIDEKGYDAVTIQDVVERANVGRTTFYAHYGNKDDLLLDSHADFASALVLRPLSYDELMNRTAPEEFEAFLQKLSTNKTIYLTITQGKDAEMVMRGVHQQMVANLSDSLEIAFAGKDPVFSLTMLTNYIIGAQLALIHWWLTNRTEQSANEVAMMLHQLQRAAIQDAYRISP